MPDNQDVVQETGSIAAKKEFHLETPPLKMDFHVKGMDNADWGMKDRLSRIFNPKSGNALILAFDHGYMMGAATGLERLDILIPSLAEDIDVFMATRGALRTCVPPTYKKGIALRCTAGSTVLADDVIHEVVGVDIEDAIRMNATCMAVQTFMGSVEEKSSIANLCAVINAGMKYNIPTLGVVAVGKSMTRTPQFFLLATRVIAELGAQIVKTYYCNDFEKITAACPVPIVVAGGKTLPSNEALTMAYRAICEGAHGVDMGRNIFQAEDPKAMAKAIGKVVHEKYDDKMAYEYYLDTKKK
jgi:3-hydroxy-5-phosphonooxypentane-2,4-dione thiolase